MCFADLGNFSCRSSPSACRTNGSTGRSSPSADRTNGSAGRTELCQWSFNPSRSPRFRGAETPVIGRTTGATLAAQVPRKRLRALLEEHQRSASSALRLSTYWSARISNILKKILDEIFKGFLSAESTKWKRAFWIFVDKIFVKILDRILRKNLI